MKRIARQGFTLVELLVVISIIALLLSVLMPALSKARKQAKRVVCASNMKQVGISQIAWSMDHKGYATQIFEGADDVAAGKPWPTGLYDVWTDILIKNKYAKDRSFFTCPDGNPTAKKLLEMNARDNEYQMFTYGLTRMVSSWASWRIDTSIIVRQDGGQMIENNRRVKGIKASDFILAGDSVVAMDSSTAADPGVAYVVRAYGPNIQFYFICPFQTGSFHVALRHLKTGLFLMADGSVAIADQNRLITTHKVITSTISLLKN